MYFDNIVSGFEAPDINTIILADIGTGIADMNDFADIDTQYDRYRY